MKSNNDMEFIKSKIENWYANKPITSLKAESKELFGYEIEDGGVPKEMEDGEPDKEGYVRWKITPSKISDLELQGIEKEYKLQFPELYKLYLMAYCHLGINLKFGDRRIFLPALPSDCPLKEIEFELNAWKPLLNAGFIPFADFEDGWGPVCFDTLNDCQIVWFEHEELFNSNFEKNAGFDKFKRKICSGFKELYECLC